MSPATTTGTLVVTAVLTLLLGVVVVVAITVATGYFVAQEFAYMSVDRSTIVRDDLPD